MLIIEGADLLGKTTLCRRLLAELPGHEYAHLSRPDPGFDHFWGYMGRCSPQLVQDRFHMSEAAYAMATARGSMLTPEVYRLVDGQLRSMGAYTVLLTAHDELLRRRCLEADRPEMFDTDTIVRANGWFGKLSTPRATAYTCDVDYRVSLSDEEPYITEADVHAILESYAARRREVTRVGERRRGLR
jgi:hypothetical protein